MCYPSHLANLCGHTDQCKKFFPHLLYLIYILRERKKGIFLFSSWFFIQIISTWKDYPSKACKCRHKPMEPSLSLISLSLFLVRSRGRLGDLLQQNWSKLISTQSYARLDIFTHIPLLILQEAYQKLISVTGSSKDNMAVEVLLYCFTYRKFSPILICDMVQTYTSLDNYMKLITP